MRAFPSAALLLIAVLLSGCVQTQVLEPAIPLEPKAASLNVENADYDWWQFIIKLRWPEDETLDLSPDLLIAERLYAPALVAHQEAIPLWRFHRRAARDKAGHRFSLIFYAEAATARALKDSIELNPETAWLKQRQLIEKSHLHQRSPQEMGQLELTSDPSWPVEIQRSWPYFIMGVSQAWLLLVQELSAPTLPSGDVSYQELVAHYRDVDEQVNTQWRDSGQHAYLHHLSAIFGYQPIRIRSSELTTF